MRLVFFGTPAFALPTLEALLESPHRVLGVVTQPDRPKGRRRLLAPPPVKEAAAARGLPIWQPANLREPAFLSLLRGLEPEVAVVVAYGKILPPAVLDLPRHGCINVHASLLPRYRGAAPIHWAVINGESETGVTTMYMAPALDAGDIILQRAVAIGTRETTGALHDRLARLGADLLLETLDLLEAGKAPRRPQDEALASYAPPLQPEDERIDWQWPAAVIFNRVRGLNPWPGAYTTWRGKRLKIWWVEPGALAAREARPGQVLAVGGEGFSVACGSGQALLVKELQPEGKAPMEAAAFVRGYRLAPGEYLGDA
ncbi:MAG: methionyl-tRNA formyltransferase [Clostridia bacterium]|nr:methionyl-tRNA formyltransferase [Clostridia bacterium]